MQQPMTRCRSDSGETFRHAPGRRAAIERSGLLRQLKRLDLQHALRDIRGRGESRDEAEKRKAQFIVSLFLQARRIRGLNQERIVRLKDA